MRLTIITVAAAAGLAVVGSTLWATYRAGRDSGEMQTLQAIETENDDAGERAEDWRDRLRDCRDAGGVFDYERGTCLD